MSHIRQEPIFAGDRAISAVPTCGLPGNDARAGAIPTTPCGTFGFGARGACPAALANSFDPAHPIPGRFGFVRITHDF